MGELKSIVPVLLLLNTLGVNLKSEHLLTFTAACVYISVETGHIRSCVSDSDCFNSHKALVLVELHEKKKDTEL